LAGRLLLMLPDTGDPVIEALAALVAMLLAAAAGLWVQTIRLRDEQASAATAAARAKLQGKRVILEADRRTAAEAAAAERTSAVDAAIAEHKDIIAKLDAERAAIDQTDTAEAAADALRRAFDQ